MKKETIYIDVEDDITTVVEKMQQAKEKIIALVPPKRASVFDSVVNLKLVHKAAQDAHKRLVLITTDKTLVNLAGGIGIYVAANLQSAPAIPATPPPEEMPSEIIDASDSGSDVKTFSLKKPAVPLRPAKDSDAPRDLKLDDKPKDALGDKKTDKKLAKAFKIPDFGLFKKRLFLIILGIILLIGLGVWAFHFAPSAKVALEGQTNRLATDVTFTVDTTLEEADFEKKELPAVSKELSREVTEGAEPTGERNVGEKATGEAELQNCASNDSQPTIPKGTVLTANGLNFLTDEAVTLPTAVKTGGGSCITDVRTVGVTAQNSGDDYNLSARSYTVSGFSNVRAEGSEMSGGTDEIVKVLTQVDVDKAKEAALTKLREGAREELNAQFGETVFTLDISHAEVVNEVTPSVPINEPANSATVKVVATYFSLGVDRNILNDFLKEQQKDSLLPNQAIFDTGLDSARISKVEAPAPNRQVFQLKTDAFAGPDVDTEELSKQLAKKSFGEAKKELESIPGVTKADIDLSPFWVYSMPRRADKIHIEIKVNE